MSYYLLNSLENGVEICRNITQFKEKGSTFYLSNLARQNLLIQLKHLKVQ